MTERPVHDLGGEPAGPLDLTPHDPTLLERRVDALMMVLRAPPHSLWTADENRRTIEGLPQEQYDGGAYYARWVFAMRRLLVEKGLLSEDEIEEKLAQVRARHAAGSDDRA